MVLGALLVAAPAAAAPAGRGAYPRDTKLRLDQVQLLGTHNSYHVRPEPPLDTDPALLYDHLPLEVQLDELGLRSFELDVHNGAELPVFHTLIIDTRSTCATLSECLGILGRWSRQHRGHVPLVVLVEPKDLPTFPDPGVQGVIDQTAAEQGLANWDAAGLDRLDAAVRRAFGRSLVTPDEVRGRFATLRTAILERGWPTLAKVRGGVIVVLSTAGPLREQFLADAPSLEGKAMFVTARLEMPAAAFVSRDAPHPAEIQRLVRQGFLVRSRTDADLVEAKAGDTTRVTKALDSGAQVLHTDFPVPDPIVGPYVVELPGPVTARCNPVSAPKRCRDRDVEHRQGLRKG